jgi:hypothetical protein
MTYASPTTKKLYAYSGNQCSHPECSRSLVAEDDKTIIGEICHIEAASSNGPRYSSSMTDNERKAFDNLILLCDEHHKIIDNPENEFQYPVDRLKKWKRDHEEKIRHKILTTNPSLLSEAIRVISAIDFNESAPESSSASFNIEDKIEFNSIKRNKFLIEDNKIYYAKISAVYNELENQGSFKKDKLLKYIKTLYLKIKGKYIKNSDDPIRVIQDNSDDIIDEIENIFLEEVEKNKQACNEDIKIAIPLIITDAFMRCKILEKPPTK